MPKFSHPRLGDIQYVETAQVEHFFGLKYASLAHAFAASAVYSAKGDNVPATQYGPTAIQPPTGCDMEPGLIQKALPHADFKSSATECLNLNICVPKASGGPLPVFVYIHGGGFAIGSNSWPHMICGVSWNTVKKLGNRLLECRSSMTKRSLAGSKLTTMTSYRLGIYGFLDSKALRDAGAPANRGLRDQRVALQWIQENIAGFGGDPKQVTVIGESAGGVSITLHLQNRIPLFKQFVAMGGTSLSMKPLPPSGAEMAYQDVLRKLDIDLQLPVTEQLKLLIETSPVKALATIGPDVPLVPVVDGDLIPTRLNFSSWTALDAALELPGTKWCSRAMLGDCQFDASILCFALMGRKPGIAMAFQQALLNTLQGHEDALQTIFEGYQIISEVSDDEVLKNILTYITDVHFYAPVIELAKSWPRTSFVYHFNEPNTWEGPNKGQASHILDVAFLFQNFNKYLDAEQQMVVQHFARDIISFINSENPYPPYSPEEGGAERLPRGNMKYAIAKWKSS